ncbi:unnamed protein product [Rotaria magnacalcarata]|uniref:ACB domain-containing protein n=1 Tax=Rotaria magnacalcarata TaxID=392030 RepID=A0A8S2MHH8_9BILA|nr:unnamed protein product [Rotaria magnacalcarata]
MASTASLQEKFNAAVKAIQRLPNDGTFQPSNEMKLTFYGLYKQATAGPCNEPRPSLFNYINRAKWDAWDKCRSMSKEAAMTAYIDEIRKILETMPQTNEVLEFTHLIGPFYEFVDDRTEENQSVSVLNNKSHHTNAKKKKQNALRSLVNGTGESNHPNQLHGSSAHPSYRHNDLSDGARYSASSVASGGGNGRHPNNNYNKETQRAILAALTKLQRDVNNILERLNRLENSSHFLQQRELSTQLHRSSGRNSLSRWFPLAGLRRRAIAFILLWPFFVFALIQFSIMASVTSGSDNEHLGIPKAVFVEDVDSFMQQPENDSTDTVIKRLDDLNSKYRFMEMNLLQKKKRLRGKLPDIQICLDMVEQLRKYRENGTDMDTNFLLAHNLYGKATIPPTDKVCLWLGANVMLEYTLDEADELLRGNQKSAQSALEKVDEDIDFLRDQITTTEVNMARLHNWAVKQKQQNKK